MNIIKTKSFELAIYTQKNINSSKLAVVIPGRLDTKDYAHMRSHVDFLAKHGYFALSFDPPGTWDSPGNIELFTTTNYIKAVNEVIEYYGNKPTLLLGHSRGGSVTILAGTSNPCVTSIAVMMASYGQPTPPSLELIKSGILLEYRDLPPGTSRTKDKKEFALPVSYFEDALQYNPAEVLKKCIKPKLLFYGNRDEFTKPDRVKEVFDSIPDPKTLHELDSDHDYRLYPDIIEEVDKTLEEFIGKYE